MPIQNILQALNEVIFENLITLTRLADEKRGCENWLQIEILKKLKIEADIEVPYENSKNICDFVLWKVEEENKKYWIELKLCITNYCSNSTKNKTGKPITNNISAIANDINRLKTVHNDNKKSYVLFIAYPMPYDYPTKVEWINHLSTIKKETGYAPNEIAKYELKELNANIVTYLVEI